MGFSLYDPEAPHYFSAPQVMSYALQDLSISVHRGEVVAVVGASGSGKSLLAESILGMFEPNAYVSGEIWFNGQQQTTQTLQALRGTDIAIIPQSIASLDPLMRVGKQVQGFGRRSSRTERQTRQRQLFAHYQLADSVANLFPFELSGGMARRILLCCALMNKPQLLIADEPTPGLDSALAHQALQDLRDFANDGGGVMLITHDLELALSYADRIAVFKDGTVIEETSVTNFANPELLSHPYTRALWHAMPEHGFQVPAEGDALC